MMCCRTRKTLTGTLRSFNASYALGTNAPHKQGQVWKFCALRDAACVICDPQEGMKCQHSPYFYVFTSNPIMTCIHSTDYDMSMLSLQNYWCTKSNLLNFNILWLTDGWTDGSWGSSAVLQGWSRGNLMISFCFSPWTLNPCQLIAEISSHCAVLPKVQRDLKEKAIKSHVCCLVLEQMRT